MNYKNLESYKRLAAGEQKNIDNAVQQIIWATKDLEKKRDALAKYLWGNSGLYCAILEDVYREMKND